MQYDHILIRYGEISTKGKNRRGFIDRLKANIRRTLKSYSAIRVEADRDRMFVLLNGEDHLAISEKLKGVFGIQNFSPAIKTEPGIEEIKNAALSYMNGLTAPIKTFKVNTRRADKSFSYSTDEVNHMVGGYLLTNTEGITVNVKTPDLTVRVEIRKEAAYISGEVIQGAGGLPVGNGGKAVLMLSGGIDSPVAGYMSMKRGLELECIHFHSPPFTSERSKQKVIDLCGRLSETAGPIKLHIVPFTEIQKLIQKQIPENYTMTSTRRLMLRVADSIREKQGALAIVTGESLGQVASQTIESMHAINEVTSTPVLRPLITMDKLEIMKIAEEIDTLEISNRPYEDCCTVFTPANPKTKPKKEKVNFYESFVDFDKLIEEAVDGVETLVISPEAETKRDETLDLF
ncbi:tRNA uracil 4-sulfurtransferase ThiI [Peribacillus kribbensis]|uniref:tRNA uracil 4-sulfurtransferase ThiI n=1 Tax=Peribacillus kribbensis TaxID=356658 RepID=UPI000403EC45|nr:tRNA uracil 4-sulfurtransferase ThiI [Peribacillus kribbensis]